MINHPVFLYQCPGTLYFYEPWAARLQAQMWGPLMVAEERPRPVTKKKRRKR